VSEEFEANVKEVARIFGYARRDLGAAGRGVRRKADSAKDKLAGSVLRDKSANVRNWPRLAPEMDVAGRLNMTILSRLVLLFAALAWLPRHL